MDQYKEYLATNVLNEGRPVNYRLLSRALGVNVNLAKQMLYDFHKTQNAKKSGSVHATYFLSGSTRFTATTQANGINGVNHDDGGIPSSSPYQSSLPDADDEPARPSVQKETLIMLAREENLEDAKSRYDEITSIHIYSLEPGPLKNLDVLSDCNREVCEKLATADDPVAFLRSYGTISNPHVKRRSGRNQAKPVRTAPAAAAAKPTPRPAFPAKNTAKPKPQQESDSKPSSQSKQKESDSQSDASTGPGKKKDAKVPSTKRETSNLFASFSKAKPKKAPAAEAAPPVDEPMLSESEGEEAEDVISTTKPSKAKDSAEAQNAKAEADQEKEQRDKALRDMMDESEDEPMEDAPASGKEEEVQGAPIDDQPKPEEKPEETITVTGGRRRGRRRVMKKKTVKDEEGFLVTKEEAVWESFSEDEPAPKKPKLPSATSKGKKGGAKQGQGNIMSFFSKK
ncbi:DNA polymerase subunit Cdc27 [Phyllosticta capitalensis]|uniref:DNA polymerase subunit Cdc27 n=1 Tax=Phyllosticta capitalensis TaxID=121624 RepID=UPI00312F63A2